MSSRTEEVRRQGESDALVAVSQKRRSLIPAVYRRLLSDAQTRRLLLGLGVSALGDGMSTVSIAWLAVLLAPSGHVGVFVGIAVAAYTLPGVVGALALGRFLRHRPARVLVLTHTWLRAGFLATIAILWATGNLVPYVYVALLAGSSVLPLTYALFQSSTTGAHLPTMLAARSAIIMVATPLGTAIGGPIVGTLGAAQTLTASGAATVLLAVLTGIIWTRKARDKDADERGKSKSVSPAFKEQSQPDQKTAGRLFSSYRYVSVRKSLRVVHFSSGPKRPN